MIRFTVVLPVAALLVATVVTGVSAADAPSFRKDIAPPVQREISDILRASIDYGLAHREGGVEHSMPLARGMERPLVDRFIGMYVNAYTLDYGEVGRRAIYEFLGAASENGLIPAPVELQFV